MNNNITKKEQFGLFLNKNANRIAFCLMACMVLSASFCFASSGADALWSQISNLIQIWVTRLGGVVMFVGGVTFGLGWMHDDGAQKTKGISIVTAGAIVVAVAALTGTFFA